MPTNKNALARGATRNQGETQNDFVSQKKEVLQMIHRISKNTVLFNHFSTGCAQVANPALMPCHINTVARRYYLQPSTAKLIAELAHLGPKEGWK